MAKTGILIIMNYYRQCTSTSRLVLILPSLFFGGVIKYISTYRYRWIAERLFPLNPRLERWLKTEGIGVEKEGAGVADTGLAYKKLLNVARFSHYWLFGFMACLNKRFSFVPVPATPK